MELYGTKPAHAQIRDYIESQINSGAYKPGDRLPTENELARSFQTSIAPVKQALESLRSSGKIYRHRGKGTFVSKVSEEDTVWTLGSIEDLIGVDTKTSFQLFDFAPFKISEEEEEKIFDSKGGNYYRIRGTRLIQNNPLLFLTVYLPDYIGEKLSAEDVTNSPIIVAIEKKIKIRLKRCIQVTSAGLADREVSRYLRVPKNSPVLCMERLYFAEERAIEFARSFYRHDLFKHRYILSRI